LRAPAPPADIRNPAAPNIDNAFQNALECSICLEILHNPVSVITRDTGNGGCLHTFCGACIVQNINAGNRQCPLDRARIRGINDQHRIAEVVRLYLQRCPDRRLPQADLDRMDRIYRPGQHVII
jgi:hypothetical protein